uniref:AIG1-type G domain-containing protein n=1 Tax=Scleropages formosus TaxID=113540 RepID=A0A8C9VEU7_SCLFO
MEMALVLLGRRGSGKSFAANTILGQAAFRAGKHTTCCVVSRGTVAGRRLLLVNAPGWSLFGLSRSAEVREEVACSPFLCPQGPSTFLLTVPVDHFKEQDRQAVEVYMGLLGEAVWQHTLVLFTWGDELRGQRIQEHVKRSGPELQSLLRKCVTALLEKPETWEGNWEPNPATQGARPEGKGTHPGLDASQSQGTPSRTRTPYPPDSRHRSNPPQPCAPPSAGILSQFPLFSCIHFTLYLQKPSRAYCRETSPQHDASTTMLESRDDLCLMNTLCLAYITFGMVTKKLDFVLIRP